MKNKLVLRMVFTILFFQFQLFISAQNWTTLNPKPTHADLWDVCFPSPDTGYLVGNNSTLLRTIDGGESWENLNYPIQDIQIRNVNFINNNTGFIAHDHGVNKTTDAGESWTFVNVQILAGLDKTWFYNDTLGFAYGYYGAIAKTVDGGESWEVLNFSIAQELVIDALQFANPQTGYIVGQVGFSSEGPLCRRTDDGGETWTDIEVHGRIDYVRGLTVLGADELWIGAGNSFSNPDTIGNDALAFHSINGGETWTPHVVGISSSSQGILDIAFIDENEGRVLNRNHVYTTIDGGNSWNDYTVHGGENQWWTFQAFSWADPQNGFFAGGGPTIVKTTDGGLTYSSLVEGQTNSLLSVCFTDTLHGCVGGRTHIIPYPVIFYTDNGGQNWQEASLDTVPYGTRIYSLAFSSPTNGWAAGMGTTPYKTTDGGQSWAYTPTGFNYWFKMISMPDEQHIFLAANTGNVIKSSDGGNTWTDISPEENELFLVNGFVFTDSQTGYLALGETHGDFSMLMKTTDGGSSWAEVAQWNNAFECMSFADNLRGIISLSNGQLFLTQDGGEGWTESEIDAPSNITYLKLFDKNTGIATIADYFVAATFDGGLTFETIYTGSNSWPYLTSNNYFLDENTGWGCGDNGMIMKYHAVATGLGKDESRIEISNLNELFFPNPAINEIQFIDKSIHSASIRDLNGKLIATYKNLTSGIMDISGLIPGVYVISAQSKSGTHQQKLIKH